MELDDEGKSAKPDPPEKDGGGKRAAVSVTDDLPEDIEFDLIDEVDSEDTENDVFARDTAIPAPAEHLSVDTLRPLEGDEDDLGAAPDRRHLKLSAPTPMRPLQLRPFTMDSMEDLEFDSFQAPRDVFGLPQPGDAPPAPQRPNYGQSQMPTAPPAAQRSLLEQAKRSMPAPGRANRPAFMATTARNPPLNANVLARGAAPGPSTPNSRAIQSPASDPAKDSALDFVDGFEPMLDSVAPPMSGLEAPDPPAGRPRVGPQDMQACYAVGDFSRALSIAEEILSRTPDDVAARRCAQNCRDVLTQMFAARIGPLDQVITVVISPDEVQWLTLDHRAGFLLALVDGQSTVDEILDISGMTRLDALKIIFDLTERQVVRLA